MKTIPFNFDKFKVSVDAGRPLQLFDSNDKPDKIQFVGFANTTYGIEIVGFHNETLESWQLSGKYGRHNKEATLLDLQMEDRPENGRNDLDFFCDWVMVHKHLTESEQHMVCNLINSFEHERADK